MSLHYTQQGARPTPTIYVVECKRCRRHIPAGVDKFPAQSLRVDCSLCGEARMYRIAEIYLGWPDRLLIRQEGSRSRS